MWRITLAVLFLAIGLRALDPVPVEELRLRVFDLYQELLPRERGQEPVVIVDIDERSIEKFGQWPWPRNMVADLVTAIVDSGAVAIGVDVLFAEPDRLSPQQIIGHYPGLDRELTERLEALPSTDVLLSKALLQAPVALGQAVVQKNLRLNVPEVMPKTPVIEKGGDPRGFLKPYPGLLRNLEILEQNAEGHGVVSLDLERDGVTRRVPAIMQAGGHLLPALALEILRISEGRDGIAVVTGEAGIKGLNIGERFLPTDRAGRLIPHYSPHDSARFVSAADVLTGAASPEKLEGKLVVLGTTAAGLIDIFLVPIGSTMSGAEIHAQVLENMLGDHLLARPLHATVIELIFLLVACLVVLAFRRLLRPAFAALSLPLVIILLFAVSWASFAGAGLLVDASYPSVVALALYGILISQGLVVEERRRSNRDRRLRNLQTELMNVSRLTAMSQLSSALAHELNQPLSAITNYLRACRRLLAASQEKAGDKPQTPGIEKVGPMMEKALGQTERAGAIIRGMRDIIERGESVRAPADTNRIVDEAVALVVEANNAARVEVSTVFAPDLPPVLINTVQVQQAVVNLVRNAIEAVAGRPRQNVEVRTELTEQEQVQVSVSDTGVGLPPEVEARLFEPFVTSKPDGMGVGLSVCRSIIETHGGQIWVEKGLAGGTAFCFTLPSVPVGWSAEALEGEEKDEA